MYSQSRCRRVGELRDSVGGRLSRNGCDLERENKPVFYLTEDVPGQGRYRSVTTIPRSPIRLQANRLNVGHPVCVPNAMLEKAHRPAHRVIPQSRFAKLDTIDEVIQRLVGVQRDRRAAAREQTPNRSGPRALKGNCIAGIAMPSISLGNLHAQSVQLFTTKRQKGWAVSVAAGTMQISAGKFALRFLQASLSQLECELVAWVPSAPTFEP
jgi:hypothetical protein